jgi:gluconate 2-dehydrogenase gamma chain
VTPITDFVPPPCNKQTVETSLKLNRRAFLQAALIAAAGAGVACSTNGTPWRFLRIDEARTLAAISDQIIPPDQDPGASWAGVVNYMDRQLCGPFQNLQQTYRRGIAGIDQSSRLIFGRTFADLDAQQQFDVLHHLEEGKAPGAIWKQSSSSEFFALLVDHTMQGYYGDPRHGGNREGASWKMLGLPYPPIRGRLRYDLTKL